MKEEMFWTACFAALLRDVGKLLQEDDSFCSETECRKLICSLLGSSRDRLDSFMDVNTLSELLQCDEEDKDNLPEELKAIICLISVAHKYAGGAQDDAKEIDYKVRPLNNIFTRLDIGKGSMEQRLSYNYLPFGKDALFPNEDKKSWGDRKILSEGFINDWDKAVSVCSTPEIFFRSIFRLLERYAWCIPADTHEEISDDSLFDRLSVASAVTACLYRYHTDTVTFVPESVQNDGNARLMLLSGDVSGIQSYIFSGSSKDLSGMARKLRARSFIISSLPVLAINALMDRLHLPESCVLMHAAGNFHILVPNTAYVINTIETLKKQFEHELFDQFRGEVSLNMSYIPICGSDLSHFGDIISRCRTTVEEKKKKPFSSLLIKDEKWDESCSTLFSRQDGRELCVGCGREFTDATSVNEGMGLRCEKEIHWGRILPNVDKLSVTAADKNSFPVLGGYTVVEGSKKQEGYSLRNDRENRLLPLWRLANYIPLIDGNLMTFSEIAGKSHGAERLGYLKADVDRLGMLFSCGFRTNGLQRFDSVSRITALSRMIDTFFTVWLDGLVRERYKECYVVFSGGDDLLIIGAWDRLPYLAYDIREYFRQFTGDNENVTISAGMATVHAMFPVAYAVGLSEEALENAKETRLPGEKEGRDQLSLFGHVMKWKYVPGVLESAEKLSLWLGGEKKLVTSGDVYRMREYSAIFEKFRLKKCVEGLRYAGLLAYDIGRKANGEDGKQYSPKVLEFMDNLRDISPNGKINNLRVACDYALLYNRRREDDE